MNINCKILRDLLTPEELLRGDYGVEREGLRVTPEGKLATTLHPEPFGNKLINPFITTDFSESQIEVVTPTVDTIDKAYTALTWLCDAVQDVLPENEFFWPQSMPCDIPEDDEIPIAIYEGRPDAGSAMAYRQGLIEKYGGKKQLISGIHLNFSFKDEDIETVRRAIAPEYSHQAFKDAVYLKIVRNYLRYRWLIIYLTGCSVGLHKSYIPDCVAQMSPVDDAGSYLETTGPSFRNSACGYKNLFPLYPDYTSVESFVEDVQGYVDKGYLSAAKELYTQIRMKPRDAVNVLESLREDGIKYLEIRTIDLNVYDPCGIAKIDMEFVHRFILYMLIKPEEDYPQWQQEGLLNEEAVAVGGLQPGFKIKRNGQIVDMRASAMEILEDMAEMEQNLGLSDGVLDTMRIRVEHPETTYAARQVADIEDQGFLGSQMKKAREYKAESQGRENILREYGDADEQVQKKHQENMTTGKAFPKL